MGKKTVKQAIRASAGKVPKAEFNPDSYYDQTPVWSFCFCDFEHEKWGLCRDRDRLEGLFKRLCALERQTWREIKLDKSGRNGKTKHHFIAKQDLIKEAQRRLEAIKLDQYEELYSLSITGEQRLWGIMDNGTYHILWYDQKHEICTSHKRHT